MSSIYFFSIQTLLFISIKERMNHWVTNKLYNKVIKQCIYASQTNVSQLSWLFIINYNKN